MACRLLEPCPMTERKPEEEAPHRLRTTFIPGRELLVRASDHLEAGVRALREAPRPDARTAMLVECLESLQEQLKGALERFGEVAPDEVLDEEAQYTVEIPKRVAPAPTASAPERTLVWARDLVEDLRRAFGEMAGSAQKPTLEEMYRNLAELMEGHQQRLARIEQDMRDL